MKQSERYLLFLNLVAGVSGVLFTTFQWYSIQQSGRIEHDFFNIAKDTSNIMLLWTVIFAVFIATVLWMAKKRYSQFNALIAFLALVLLLAIHQKFGLELNISSR